ncbi:prolyl oligopeptidase family serine peptidase [Colwellia sp. 1_MG-2023]|uniref:S9 family peptidase n=1 Tax=unclassified Colwellia TaxID=196834 RepID=UPI001C09B848|nr:MULTISPECIES: prolyl oligopeptidase family serine peptidase [unclassified Colwellia]MBU2924710.1 prolyl oligopeptidase family serine peptidase [Colwellia sp. C2M11]MDO6653546.1 prolyl oligopeptidase family serine peptidase [Colwellia sp. 3_MG-2023]MDO6666353.1 prolyl oligopeptidase family serine peptidase [Colwellia sp. 2_MG-2023]MDO6690809.1 prolyl oligopeptidase family serine peptidase [Colwellia sp. 1_MG-2023]
MKLNLIAAVLSISLVACASTEDTTKTSSTSLKSPATVLSPTSNSGDVTNNNEVITLKKITLEKIMSDPDWFGRAPESWYWGDDSNTIFYKQKQLGNPLRDLWVKNLGSGSQAQQVSLSELHKVADSNAKSNSDGSLEIYSFEGNVFVKNVATKSVKQITYTSANESDALFLTNGKIAYRIDNVFYAHDLVTGQVVELANLQMAEKPKGIEAPTSYLAKEQHKLINYIALQQRNGELKEQQKDSLTAQNTTVTQTKYYFGKDNQVSHASLSPAGDKLFVSITEAKSSRDDSDIMPNYVTKDGVIAAEKVRARVANNRQYKEELFFIDLKAGKKVALNYESLPNFDTDVLAAVKKENYAREGKTYKSSKTARNIHLLQMWFPVKWNDDGSQVALMLEAWDNKTRWLATVDFEKEALVNQHELQDDAWINWSFNEFDWVGNDALYYLSEESGYSHLYYKTLNNGKTKQLTSGKFEVSDVTLTKDQKRFIFKANKKHPGIHEIYQVDLANNVTALTDLGGQNSYALSPDESALLIEHSSLTMPPELYVQSLTSNAPATQITHTVSDEFKALPWVSPSIVAIPSSKQKEPIYSRVYLPKNYDKTTEKNRAVMFTHGAGYLQNSHLGWSGYFREFMFHSMLVQQGYVVIDMDYRASAGYGRDWRTSIYRHMGKVEVEDMRDGVNWIVDNANVDAKRVGTYGGSYGGFLTLMSMFTDPTLFESGSAIRLVSDWAYYNHGYTSNILNTPEDDAIAYERSSPIYFAEGLTKPLLINAPMVDDNVFFEDTVRLVQRLIELEKQDFETAIYPVEPHGFVQPSSWLNEYRRIYKLFENTL